MNHLTSCLFGDIAVELCLPTLSFSCLIPIGSFSCAQLSSDKMKSSHTISVINPDGFFSPIDLWNPKRLEQSNYIDFLSAHFCILDTNYMLGSDLYFKSTAHNFPSSISLSVFLSLYFLLFHFFSLLFCICIRFCILRLSKMNHNIKTSQKHSQNREMLPEHCNEKMQMKSHKLKPYGALYHWMRRSGKMTFLN